MRLLSGLLRIMVLSALLPADAAQAQQDSPHPGLRVYEAHCAACHDNEAMRAPARDALRSMTRETLSYTLTAGIMSIQGQNLSRDELTAVVDYLAADEISDEWITGNLCAAGSRRPDLSGTSVPTAGVDAHFSRHLPAEQGGLRGEQLGSLELAWAIGFPGLSGLRSAPAIAGDTLFYPAAVTGQVLAIDVETGCFRWARDVGAPLRASATLAEPLPDGRRPVIVTDEFARVHAIDAITGENLWTVSGVVDPEAATRLTGAPMAHDGRVIIPVSASGVARGADPDHECCDGRGAVLALDAATGERLWRWVTMPPPSYTGERNAAGARLRGPSGAPIWSSPTLDAERGLLYVTTGENTSLPATDTSNAIIALDIDTGEPVWQFQAIPDDVWNMACTGREPGPNCPSPEDSIRRDWDFGSAAVPVSLPDGRDLLLAGQKSGHLWALDPDDGSVVWQQRVGDGGALGGNHWGIAVDGERVFLTINDPHYSSMTADQVDAGVFAFDSATGEPVWDYRSAPDCADGRRERVPGCERRYGFSATPLVVDGAVVAGNIDGRVFIFDSRTGEILNRLDTARAFATVNGVEARGGSIDAHSVSAGAGMLFIGSGYERFGQQPGNVLLAFRPAH